LLVVPLVGLAAAPARGTDDGVWIETSCRGPISYRTDNALPPPSLFSSDRYLLIPVPGGLDLAEGSAISPLYFIVFRPDGSLVEEPLGPFYSSDLVSYQKLANGLPSLLFEDEAAAQSVGESLSDLQKVILGRSDLGRRIARELAIEVREVVRENDSFRLAWASHMCCPWNIDPSGSVGFVASQHAAHLLRVDGTGAVESLWESPLHPAPGDSWLRGRSLFSRSGDAIAIG
jgi:hypothetical protein